MLSGVFHSKIKEFAKKVERKVTVHKRRDRSVNCTFMDFFWTYEKKLDLQNSLMKLIYFKILLDKLMQK